MDASIRKFVVRRNLTTVANCYSWFSISKHKVCAVMRLSSIRKLNINFPITNQHGQFLNDNL